jgi:hypothetical protein
LLLLMLALTVCCHANVEHNKHSVLPVPVGLSSKAFSERVIAVIARSINALWHGYGSFGKSTATPAIWSIGMALSRN